MMDSSDPRPLDQVQRWMLAVVTHPQGVVSGIRADESQQEIPISPDDLESVITRSRQCTSIERLQVYGNAYYTRLIECLQDEYPSLRHALGDESFDAFALAYLRNSPPTSYTLSSLGAEFPRFLRETRPGDLPPEIHWPEFLMDLATLERTYAEVFDAPGPEQLTLLTSEALSSIPADEWSDVKLIPVECLRLLELRFAVHEYATSVRRGQQPSIPISEPTFLAVSRIDFIVRRWPLTRTAFQLLGLLCQGMPIGMAIEQCVDNDASSEDELWGNISDWFHDWATTGLFRGLQR